MPLHRYMYLNICGYINIVYTYICIEISLFVFIFNYLEIVFVLYFITCINVIDLKPAFLTAIIIKYALLELFSIHLFP